MWVLNTFHFKATDGSSIKYSAVRLTCYTSSLQLAVQLQINSTADHLK